MRFRLHPQVAIGLALLFSLTTAAFAESPTEAPPGWTHTRPTRRDSARVRL